MLFIILKCYDKMFLTLSKESSLTLKGTVRKRSEDDYNDKISTGKIEIFSVIFLLLSLGIEKITGFVLKLFDPNIWKTAKTQSPPNKHKKTQKINLKTCLTLFICYEIAIILILADSYDACDFIFSYDFCMYDGFQYLVMCLFVPALVAVIVMWKQEIKNFLKRIWQIISK